MSGPDAERPLVGDVSPSPSPEELAAIVAAIEVAWPRPAAAAPSADGAPAWRFSGRWWARPMTVRRERPWAGGRP